MPEGDLGRVEREKREAAARARAAAAKAKAKKKSVKVKPPTKGASSSPGTYDREDQAAKAKSELQVKKKTKKKPLPVPSFGAIFDEIYGTPKGQGTGKTSKRLPYKYAYQTPADLAAPGLGIQTQEDRQRIERYNQELESRRRAEARSAREARKDRRKQLARMGARERRYFLNGQEPEDFIRNGRDDSGIDLGGALKAAATAVARPAVEALFEAANRPVSRTPTANKYVDNPYARALGLAGETYVEQWAATPSLGHFLTGRPYDTGGALAGAAFLGTMATPFAAVDNAADAGLKALKSGDDISQAVTRASQKAKGRRVWSERLGEWMETAEPVAGSRTGRAIERGTEKARKAVHRTPLSGPLSSLHISRTGDEKIGEEIARTSRQTVRPVLTSEAKEIVRLGKKLNRDEQYALVLIAEGGGPVRQIAYAREQAARLAEAGNKRAAAAQMTHAARLEGAAKYVLQGEDGKWYIAPGASDRLKKIEELWPAVNDRREDLYAELGILSPSQMEERVQLPGRIVSGAQRVNMTQGDRYDLAQSEHRARIEQDIRDLGLGDEYVEDVLSLHDEAALNLWRQAIEKAKKELKTLQKAKRDGEIMTAEQEDRLRQLKAIKANKAWELSVAKDLYYAELGGVWTGFPESVKAFMNYQDAITWALSNRNDLDAVDFVRRLRDATDSGEGLMELLDFRKLGARGAAPIAKRILAKDLKLPPEIADQETLTAAINHVYRLAQDGEFGRYWYKIAAEQVMIVSRLTGVEPEKVAQLFAIYSQATDTVVNVAFVRNAIAQFQKYGTVFTGRFPTVQSPEAEAVLKGGQWKGRKRSSFYMNIIEDVLGSEEYAKRVASGEFVDKPVTVDRWVVRMFAPNLGRDVPAQYYDALEQVIQEMAARIGWEPKELQAAAWVTAKLEGLGEAKRAGVRDLAGAQDAFEYGVQKYFGPDAEPFAAIDTHPDELRRQSAVKAAQGVIDEVRGQDLIGLPGPVEVPGLGQIHFRSNADLQRIASEYMNEAGLEFIPPKVYADVDPERGRAVADAYDDMLDINDPKATPGYRRRVLASYKAFTEETMAQYEALTRNGYKFEFMPAGRDPYGPSPRYAMLDIAKSKHMYVYPTDEGFGTEVGAQAGAEGNPLLALTGLTWRQKQPNGKYIQKPVTYNDLFRGVHDVLGHVKEGNGMRAVGEENAWRAHVAMYSPKARPAMTTETRGQNSWVNWGPHGEANRTAKTEDTIYAEQKLGLLPKWVVTEGADDVGARRTLARGAEGEDAEGLGSAQLRSAPFSRGDHKTAGGVHYPGRATLTDPNMPEQVRAAFVRDHPEAADFLSYIAIGDQIVRSGLAPGILWHELGHYAEKAWMEHGLDKYIDDFKAIAGPTQDREVWALALERLLVDPSQVNLPAKQKEALLRFAGFAADMWEQGERHFPDLQLGDDGYDYMTHAERREADEAFERIRGLFEALFSYENPKKGFRIVGGEDFDEGRFYLKLKRGLPVSWRKPIARAREFNHAFSTMFSPNQKRAISLYADDPEAKKQWLGFLKEMGYWKGNATDAVGESGIKAARIGTVLDLRNRIMPLTTKAPVYADDIPVREHIADIGKSNPELRRAMDLLEDMELNGRRVDYSELEGIDIRTIEELRKELFPDQVNGVPADQFLDEAMNEGLEVEGIRWVSRESLEAAGVLASPGTLTAQKRAWTGEILGQGFDMVNNLIKVQMLQLNPAYYTMNFLGNEAMSLMQQGIFFFPNLAWASKLHQDLEAMDVQTIHDLMGSGVQSIARLTYKGDPLGHANILNEFATKMVDRLPRFSAWTYEARKLGIKDAETVAELLKRARTGDEEATRVLDHITRRAKDALVDYDRLNPFEKKYLGRTLLFYPWIKGATRWTLRFPIEHPVMTLAFAAMYAIQQQKADQQLGERPWYQDLAVPLGYPTIEDGALGWEWLTVERGGREYPFVMNPKQLLTMSTPYDLAKSAEGFVRGIENRQGPAELLTPLLEAGMTSMSGKRRFDDADVPVSLSTFFGELFGAPPVVKKIQSLGQDTELDNRLYPRSIEDKVASIFGGSLTPLPYNPEKGKWMAAGNKGKAPETETREKLEEFEDAFGMPAPPAVRDAYRSKAEWKWILSQAHDKKSDLTDEELVSLKYALLLRHKPQYRNLKTSIEQALAAGEASVVDSWIEKELGWNDLAEITEAKNQKEKARG